MTTEPAGLDLGHWVALLAAGVVAAPLFRKLGLGSVLGYLAAGVAVGPFGLRLFTDSGSILNVAELGVVMFLFLIGLEMRPTKLWTLRGEIFGLGLVQVIVCGALLSGVGTLAGLPPAAAVIGAMGFVLSSTAVIMKMLDESGETATEAGQRAVAILLFEDLSIIPLLALVAMLAPLSGQTADVRPAWQSIALGLTALGGVLAAGRWLLNPFFALLAKSGAREVMTAAALLVVLGAALFMEWGGLSMALGAFIAGVQLSESSFRHQLEVDVEPFRGILLGLFFIGVGMSLDLAVVVDRWPLVLSGVLVFMLVKAVGIFGVARLFGAGWREASRRAALFAQGGEFAFVLYAAALGEHVIDDDTAAIMSAIVILSMALTPLVALLAEKLTPKRESSIEGVEAPNGLTARVLFVGFGRFAQVASQALLARGVDVSLIETDVDMIRAAANFGFKVYYGDGQRLDVLRASGAETAIAILVCVDKPEVADRIVELSKAEFPQAKIFARAYDRGHAMRLVKAGVDYQIRETFESALSFGGEVLRDLGWGDLEVSETLEEVRERDTERFELQLVGGLDAGRSLMRNNQQTPEPEPFTAPLKKAQALNEEAAEAIAEEPA